MCPEGIRKSQEWFAVPVSVSLVNTDNKKQRDDERDNQTVVLRNVSDTKTVSNLSEQERFHSTETHQ